MEVINPDLTDVQEGVEVEHVEQTLSPVTLKDRAAIQAHPVIPSVLQVLRFHFKPSSPSKHTQAHSHTHGCAGRTRE